MKKTLFALALAGALMVPRGAPAAAGDPSTRSPGIYRQNQTQSGPSSGLPLPPVPYLETMPWLTAGWVWKSPHVDAKWWLDINKSGDFDFMTAPDHQFSHTPTSTVVSNNS